MSDFKPEVLSLGVDEHDFNLLVTFNPLREVVAYRSFRSEKGRKQYLSQLLAQPHWQSALWYVFQSRSFPFPLLEYN
jgi:hypothetical protein